VVEASKNGQSNDLATRLVRCPSDTGGWDSLPDSLVRPRLVKVRVGVLLEDAPQMGLVEDDDMVQALAPDAAKIPLTDGVQIRRPGWDTDDFDARSLSDRGDVSAEFAVVVADQEPRAFTERA